MNERCQGEDKETEDADPVDFCRVPHVGPGGSAEEQRYHSWNENRKCSKDPKEQSVEESIGNIFYYYYCCCCY